MNLRSSGTSMRSGWSLHSFWMAARLMSNESLKASAMATSFTLAFVLSALIAAPLPRPPQPTRAIFSSSLPAAWAAAGDVQSAGQSDARRNCRRAFQKLGAAKCSSCRSCSCSCFKPANAGSPPFRIRSGRKMPPCSPMRRHASRAPPSITRNAKTLPAQAAGLWSGLAASCGLP